MVSAILTDIEGTTSSLSFVKDVLFPYARQHIGDFIRAHRQDPVVAELLDDAAQLANGSSDIESIIERMIHWIDTDQKVTPLKSLQGLIWENGYRQGDFKGHVYPDAVEALKTWHDRGIELYIYSSGSVYAQKLLFGHTEFGDLTPLFSGYFDTHIGGKKESDSYLNIAEQIDKLPQDILFLSDIVEELDAAGAVGYRTCRLLRERLAHDNSSHPTVSTFAEIHV
ncbi:MAG: acireductone synthase [Methylomicrobium sp.]